MRIIDVQPYPRRFHSSPFEITDPDLASISYYDDGYGNPPRRRFRREEEYQLTIQLDVSGDEADLLQQVEERTSRHITRPRRGDHSDLVFTRDRIISAMSLNDLKQFKDWVIRQMTVEEKISMLSAAVQERLGVEKEG